MAGDEKDGADIILVSSSPRRPRPCPALPDRLVGGSRILVRELREGELLPRRRGVRGFHKVLHVLPWQFPRDGYSVELETETVPVVEAAIQRTSSFGTGCMLVCPLMTGVGGGNGGILSPLFGVRDHGDRLGCTPPPTAGPV